MIYCTKTDSGNTDFQNLVRELDADLKIRDGADNAFYAQFNKIAVIKHAIVAYENKIPVGCGAIKEYSQEIAEIKRMYVPPDMRGKGIAATILASLESWAKELGYKKCILETGKRQPEAIALYKKSNYEIIPNYGQYQTVENSVCFEKKL
ncbi:MAG: GNAT family N-acetyltransferase [Bacteroidetes bacterium]|nr:GNAT family N-acetyltransferase [Bacteroidota bacterium]